MYVMEDDSAISGGWKNYHMTSEYMHVADLFLNNFIKLVNFLSNFCQLDKNSRLLGCFSSE
jgi:hypothetical protein